MPIIDKLRAEGKLEAYFPLCAGTLKSIVNGHSLLPTACVWGRNEHGLICKATAPGFASYLLETNAALITPPKTWAIDYTEIGVSGLSNLIYMGASHALLSSSTNALSLYLGASNYRTWTASTRLSGKRRIAIVAIAGTAQTDIASSTCFQDGSSLVVSSTVQTGAQNVGDTQLILGEASVGFVGYNRVAVFNRVLTSAEQAELYTDWMTERPQGRISGRRLRQPYPTQTPAQYVANGIVLDAPGHKRNGKSVDLSPSGYDGTLVGPVDTVVDKVVFEEGLRVNGIGSANHGNVTQLNSAAAFTFSDWIEVSSPVAAAPIFAKRVDASHTVEAAWLATGELSLSICNGDAACIALTAAGTVKTGLHHVAFAYSAGAAAAYFDGVATTLTQAVGHPFPATTPNLAAANLILGSTASASVGWAANRLWTSSLSAAQVLAEYQLGAKTVTYSAPLSDVPVTLANITVVGAPISDWDLQRAYTLTSGQWSVTDDAALAGTPGRHWVECVAAGVCSRKEATLWGTRHWRVTPGASTFVGCGTVNGVHNVAAQNGYFVEFTNNALYLGKAVAGVYSRIGASLGAYVAGTAYELMLSVHSLGVFGFWIKGGAYTTWTSLSNVALVDGNMEAAGTGAWLAGLGVVLTKETSSPHSGTKNLRVTGVQFRSAGQFVLTIGQPYHLVGWARGDGTIGRPTVGGLNTAFYGTLSNSWQYFDIIDKAAATNIVLYQYALGGTYVEFDDITITQVDTSVTTTAYDLIEAGAAGNRFGDFATYLGVVTPRVAGL